MFALRLENKLVNSKPCVLICNSFGFYKTLEVLDFCFKNNIILCYLLFYTSYKLQPYDVAVFTALKAASRDKSRGHTEEVQIQLVRSISPLCKLLSACSASSFLGQSVQRSCAR
jgi:hypothetical protein